jgi:tetratricopeptide (TPR) repeat protein
MFLMSLNWKKTLRISLALLCLAGSLFLMKSFVIVSDPQMIYERALSLVETEHFDEADQVLVKLRKLRDPSVLDHGLQARVDIAKGRLDQAIASLSAIPDDHPLAGWARLRCGQLERSRLRFRQAEKWLQKVIDLDENSVEARRELVYVYGMQLRRADLHEQLRRLNKLTLLKAKEIWVWCMVRDLAWWHPEEHVPILEKAIEADPEDFRSRIALAEVLRRQGLTDQALSKIEQSPENRVELRAKRMELLIDQNRMEQVEVMLDQIAVDEPSVAILRGRMAMSKGDPKSAVRFFELAEIAEPGRREIVANLGQASIQAGDSVKGKNLVQMSGKIDSLNNLLLKLEKSIEKTGAETWRELAKACEDAGRVAEARAWQSLIIANNPFDQPAQSAIFRIDSKLKTP